jgi:hypothetical protein
MLEHKQAQHQGDAEYLQQGKSADSVSGFWPLTIFLGSVPPANQNTVSSPRTCEGGILLNV